MTTPTPTTPTTPAIAIAPALPTPPNSLASPAPVAPTARQDSLIEYPSLFPIKVMGLKAAGFVEAVVHVARQFDPGFDATSIELRPSKADKYLGITVTVNATSREQLDDLYRTLSTHPMVKIVL